MTKCSSTGEQVSKVWYLHTKVRISLKREMWGRKEEKEGWREGPLKHVEQKNPATEKCELY
jgi:hypothetical protein